MINRDLTEQKIANWVEEARNSFDNHRGARSAILALLGAGIGAGVGAVKKNKEK